MQAVISNIPKKILVLEDDQNILDLLTDWLTSLGYQVISHNSVVNIIQLVTDTRPDLVLIDYLLGGINGGEYCSQLKKHPETACVPVIMLSAHQRVIDSLGHYGWDAFVAKPFELDILARQITNLLEQHSSACA